jgi:CheY-like chemotaxis protein
MRSHGGLGLGLAIVDYLVRQQAGSVIAESAGIGKGASFTVDFPLTSSEVIGGDFGTVAAVAGESQVVSRCTELLADPKLRNRRILLVEDDLDTQELIMTVLRRHGANVTAVASSAAALAELNRARPDVIISDIGMPSENGYELIKKIRALTPENGGHVPAIALTAYAGAVDRRRALLAGFQTHLAKPVEPDDLVAVILSMTFRQEPSGEPSEC